MLGVLAFCLCWFLSVSVVVLGVAVVCFVLVLWGLFECGGVGVVWWRQVSASACGFV